jgi:hypothetical protein
VFIFCNQLLLIDLKFLDKDRYQIYVYNVSTVLAENKTSITVIKRSPNNDQNMEIAGGSNKNLLLPLAYQARCLCNRVIII